MADPRADARERGLVPRAPGFVGLLAVLGGLVGVATGALAADWPGLARSAWGGGAGLETATAAARGVAWAVAGGALAGGLLGAAAGHLLLGAWAPGLRLRAAPGLPRPRLGLAWTAAVAAGLALLPWVLPRLGGGDPGRVLAWAAPGALVTAVLLALVPALLERALARRRWRRRVDPWPPPRRSEDEVAPEVRTALRSRAGEPPVSPGSSPPGAP